MASHKIYAGASLRETRNRHGLTQRIFAEQLGVSLPYLSQMENNHRPISAGVLLRLASQFQVDVGALASGDTDRMIVDMAEALADPFFDTPPSLPDLRLAASNAPGLVRSFLELYRAHRDGQDRLAALDEAIGATGQKSLTSPWEEVRDFFHYCDNHIDAVDRAAERFACPDGQRVPPMERAMEALRQHGFTFKAAELPAGSVFLRQGSELTLNNTAEPATLVFQLLNMIAREIRGDLLDATLDLNRFHSQAARDIARLGLANYFAGAALMPYRLFLASARDERHDLERLAHLYGASLEQVAHRLSTLQRSGDRGVPFFFVRVDQAGTITKRHSATLMQFARFGGACPLWNVHRAFETPNQFLRQLAQTPDGVRYLCLSREVQKPGGSFRAPVRRFAICLGCEVSHAKHLVYADDLDVENPAGYERIGISCRICPRPDCHQRSVPPIDREVVIPNDRGGPLPYAIG